MMEAKQLTVHACEQVLRFTQVAHWDDLSEERKVQLGFNMGIMSLGLGLSKEEGYTAMWNVREGITTIQALRDHVARLVAKYGITVDADHIARSF